MPAHSASKTRVNALMSRASSNHRRLIQIATPAFTGSSAFGDDDNGESCASSRASHERHRQYVLLERGALFEPAVPACEMVETAPVRHQAPIAIGDQADWNIAHRERVAGD